MSDVVDLEGVYDAIPDDVYHGDKNSLSSSGARKLLPPSCPALFRYEQDHRRKSTTEFDIGHAAHALVLGYGAEIQEIDAPDWKTKAAREERDLAYAAGKTPLLTKEHNQVKAMASTLKKHPVAAMLFTAGVAEQSLYWRDAETGVWLRARPDWMPETNGGRLIITDYKTAVSSNPARFSKSAADFGYHCQAAWYLDAAIALGLADDPAFVFVVQEKSAPYLASVVELDRDAIELGRRLNRRAIDTYAACVAANHWPGWSDEVELVHLPTWAAYQAEETLNV